MVIAKWIPFGAQQSTVAVSTKPEPIPVVSSADAKKFGLENFGNTCYANSVLQALYFCTPFRELLLQSSDQSSTHTFTLPPSTIPIPTPTPAPSTQAQIRPKPQRKYSAAGATADASISNGPPQPFYPPIPSSSPTLCAALRSLFLFISKHPEDKGVVPPRAFIDKLKEVNELFRSTMHQDAHEFLNYLLNKIVEEIEEEKRAAPFGDDLSNPSATLVVTTSSSSGSSSTLVHRLFEGVLTSETRCLTCETVSSRDESFLDLSIDIEQNSSVTACLRQFSASEMLCQRNKFFCDSCCDLQEAEKRMKIKKLPNVLALHLKRFKYQEDVQKYIKLAYRVAFPFELRLFNTVDDTDDADRLYELFAIVVHIGNGPHHGHYISLIKTLGSWFVFDDDVVDAIKESDIPKYFGDSNAGSAYVLYYQAVDIDLAGLGLRTSLPDLPEQLPTQTTDSRSSPQQHAYALPPGLIDETESSEISDPPFPVTPSQSYLPIPDKPAIKAISTLGLKPNVVHAEEPSLSPNLLTPPTAGTSAIGGLFNSLRRGPSAKAKAPGPSWLESRKSFSELPPRVPNVPPLPVSDEQQMNTVSSPPAPPPPLPTTNEKQRKETEKKTNTWFKRKNVKTRPETGNESSPIVPSSHADEDGVAHSPATPFSPWRRSSGHTPKHSADEGHRRPSEPILFASTATPSMASPALHSSNILSGRRNGYDSPSAGSASSSLGSTSGVQGPYKNIEFPKFSASSTHVHTLPSGAQPPISPHHKRSLSQLSQKRKSHNTPGSPPPQLPPRPVSASDGVKGKSVRSTYSIPPVPSLPPSTPTAAFGNGSMVERREYESGTIKGKGRDDEQRQPHYLLRSTVGHEHGTSIGANSSTSTSTTSSASSNLKRVSRKLSLTAPILGFGRKDKDKDKERQKDRDRDRGTNLPPSSFSQMGSRI